LKGSKNKKHELGWSSVGITVNGYKNLAGKHDENIDSLFNGVISTPCIIYRRMRGAA
jgi:hypothetical protein